MTVVYVLLAVVLALGIAWVVSYNRFVSQRNLVEESWRQIDVELRRRHDLVPNLVETVTGFIAHEKSVLEAVVSARARATATERSGSLQEKAAAENELTGSLRGLLAVAESYPQLQSAGAFQQLQAQLAETEDRLAAARRFYNGNVRALNTRVESVPSSLVAGVHGFQRADYFELDALERLDLQVPPQIDFGTANPALEPPRP